MTKKKLYPKREYKTETRICRCTHQEGMHGFSINPIDKKTWKQLNPCRTCECPDYKHMRTKKETITL